MDQPPWPPPSPDAARRTVLPARVDDGAILGGVARDLGARTGVDPLWYRIGFVVLTTFGGFGAFLYCGAWLILRGRDRSPSGLLVAAGIAVVGLSTVVVLGGPSPNFIESPWTLVFMLAGIAVALWQPRAETPQATVIDDQQAAASAQPAATMVTVARPPRPPSALGRWTLAAALVVGAAGAVVYQLADDGLHPERWLGAAAVVCGIGVTVGAWRGRALWLVLPGLLFAGSGFVAGHASRAGIDDLQAGTREFSVDAVSASQLPAREDLVAGTIEVTVYSAPPERVRSDLRVGFGEIEIVVDDDVTVEVRTRVHDGDIVVDGIERQHDGQRLDIRVGPEPTPDVVIDATVSMGRVEIIQRSLGRDASRDGSFGEG